MFIKSFVVFLSGSRGMYVDGSAMLPSDLKSAVFTMANGDSLWLMR